MIRCENLVKVFLLEGGTELWALQGLDIDIAAGEMVGLVGASGSGKSTLLNVLGGLVQPTAGLAMVNGVNLLGKTDAELDHYRREEVGFVWQQSTRNLIPWLNAVENVAYPMWMAGRNHQEAERRARELIDLVGLSERATHRIEMLSGGEQSRVAIAIALANEPTLLLADEPTGELDTETAKQIYTLFRQLNTDIGLTILIVSHDPDIAHHVDRVMLIRDGKLASETVRRRPSIDAGSDTEDVQEPEQTFENLVVLDNSGRLQIPPDVRDALGLQNRVRLEMTEGGVVLRPVEAQAAAQEEGESTTIKPAAAEPKPTGFLSRWFSQGDR